MSSVSQIQWPLKLARCFYLSNYGIAITGYAAIVPECGEEGLFAYFSLAHQQKIVSAKRLTSSEKHPYDVQVDYAKQVIQLVHDYLRSKKKIIEKAAAKKL